MNRENDHGPPAPANYPGHYRPHQTATPRSNFSTPEISRNHQSYREGDNLAYPSRQSQFPYLEVRRYETRQYGAAGYVQARHNSAQNPITPRNLHYSERLGHTQYSQGRHYDMRERRAESSGALNNPARSSAVPRPTPRVNTTALEYPVENTRIYLRSIKARNPRSTMTTFWTLHAAPDQFSQMKESWSSVQFSLNLSIEKTPLGAITKKFVYLHCTQRSSNNRASLRFDMLPRPKARLAPHRPKMLSPSFVLLQLWSPGIPSGTESIQEDNWRTILKNVHSMLLQATAHPSTLQLELDNLGDIESINSFFGGRSAQYAAEIEASGAKKNVPIIDRDIKTMEELQQENPKPLLTQNGIAHGGELCTGGASGVEKTFSIANDFETPRGPRQTNSIPQKNPTSQNLQNDTANGEALFTGGTSGVKTKFPDSDTEKPGRSWQRKRKKQEPEASEISVSDSERPRLKKKKKLVSVPKQEPQPEQERKITVVSSDTESPEEVRQKKKKKSLPSEPEGTEEPRRKKKKPLPSKPRRKGPVNSDSGSDSPEEPRRKKKIMILPSGRERRITVDNDSGSDSDILEEPRQRKEKKARPSKPGRPSKPRQKAPFDSDSDSPGEQRVKKKKKSQAPIVLSDSVTPEDSKRKKKKSRPSESEPAPPASRGRKPKQDKSLPTPKVPHSVRSKSKRKVKQTPPPSPPRSPSPDPSTPPPTDTNLDDLQKRLAQINEAKNELIVEELELKAKVLRQMIHSNKQGGIDGGRLRRFTCSACGKYGHRRDSWKCEKHSGRKRVLG